MENAKLTVILLSRRSNPDQALIPADGYNWGGRMSSTTNTLDGLFDRSLLSPNGSTRPAADLGVHIRPAKESDRTYLRQAFEEVLSPFYGGDHRAHADRLLNTQLSGGDDRRGRLSVRQMLYVLCWDERRVGALNLVFKQQNTCKISPLLLHPADYRNHGLGNYLLQVAETVARDRGARQIYCTVAERNHDALSFFLQAGFVRCGSSPDQYKHGYTEVHLRRPLSTLTSEEGPESIISVAEVHDPRDWKSARDLLLDHVGTEVSGATPGWLDALWAGTRPTGSGEGLTWVFSAKDRCDRHRAAAVGVGKKGEAVKVMPIAASDIAGFRAMVIDLPSLLVDKGRKAYLHIAPDADQLSALQEAGWRLEAMFPAAYATEVVTQQWAYPLGEDMSEKNMRIHNKYLQLIKTGVKTLEIRVGYKHIKKVRPGDTLRLFSGTDRTPFEVNVAAVRTYRDFADLLANEDVAQALPGLTATEALDQLRRIYPKDKEDLGVLVFELKIPGGPTT
jgi:ASC-1-like (ASCH) protein/GNAT superfamily N-acetyltransferase